VIPTTAHQDPGHALNPAFTKTEVSKDAMGEVDIVVEACVQVAFPCTHLENQFKDLVRSEA
jgi:hypothetical protein